MVVLVVTKTPTRKILVRIIISSLHYIPFDSFLLVFVYMFPQVDFCSLHHHLLAEENDSTERFHLFLNLTHCVFISYTCFQRCGFLRCVTVSFAVSVNMHRESNESISPTHRMWTLHLHWNFSQQLWHHKEKAEDASIILHYTKTSKKGSKTI